MAKVFNVTNIFIVVAFFLSQIANVNAHYLRNIPQKEEVVDYVMEKAENMAPKVVMTTAFSIPTVNYGTTHGTFFEGKIEKVVELVTIGTGLLITGYVISFISSVIGWIKDITIMLKT
ncbi:hypothetical protein HWV54_05715 [Bartonella alsatica]|uniref:Uncharacterized protein n=2 Tax=Bartonella alsatica TaxID=52764 RepID=J1IUK3_9HYPH|nr:hypothetical protein [Bartonella alsatica]EJF75282.1 hypothetical protein MEC_00758 [Bartonella alsatica IBS 382]QLC52348.1 hypothetical protein HWV54_05715 [Bartonella alsatica]